MPSENDSDNDSAFRPATHQTATHKFSDFNRISENGRGDGGMNAVFKRRVVSSQTQGGAWEHQALVKPEQLQSKRAAVIHAILCTIGFPDMLPTIAAEWLTKDGVLNHSAVMRDLKRLWNLTVSDKTVASAFEQIKSQAENIVSDPAEKIASQAQALTQSGQRLRALLQTPGSSLDDDALQRHGQESLALARVTVQQTVISGRSVSDLPAEVDIDSVEQDVLNALRHAGHDPTVGKPLQDLAIALGDFDRGGTVFAMGVHAARVATIILGNSCAGLTAQLQLAFFARSILGFGVWLAELRRIRSLAVTLDPVAEKRKSQRYAEFKPLDVAGLIFATYLLEATTLTNMIVTGESADPKADYRLASQLTEHAKRHATAVEDAGVITLLEAEVLAVGESLGDPSATPFWVELGWQQAIKLLARIRIVESCGPMVALVDASFRKAGIPEPVAGVA